MTHYPYSAHIRSKEELERKYSYLKLTPHPLTEEEFQTTTGMMKFTPSTKMQDLFFELMNTVSKSLTNKTDGVYDFIVFDNGTPYRTIIFDKNSKSKIIESIGHFIQFNNDSTIITLEDSLLEKVFCTPINIKGQTYYFNFNLNLLTKLIEEDVRKIIYPNLPSFPIRENDERLNKFIKLLLSTYSEIFNEIKVAYKEIKNNFTIPTNSYNNFTTI